MKIRVMFTTERDGELVAHLAAQRLGLGEFGMVRIAWRSLADEAGLCAHKLEVGFVASANFLSQGEPSTPVPACLEPAG